MTSRDGLSEAGSARSPTNGADGIGSVMRAVVVDPVPLVLARPGASPTRAGGAANGRRAGANGRAAANGAVDRVPLADASGLEAAFRAGYGKCEAEQRAAFDAMAENSRRAAFEQGMVEGRRQGLDEGREAARLAAEREARTTQELVTARLARLDQLLAALSEEMQRRLASAEEEMVALCHGVVCRVLGEQLVTREGVACCVRQAVQEAGGGAGLRGLAHGQVALHVHPRDLASLESDEDLAAWMRQNASGPGAVQWVPDERVGPGGCIIRSPEGSLDARIETQMASLRKVLLQTRPGQPVPPDASPPPSDDQTPRESP
jgi:flagellar assembly protein FliH